MTNPRINPGTVAAIAASLMAQSETMRDDDMIFSETWKTRREKRIEQFVCLAIDICEETLNVIDNYETKL